MGGPVCAGQGGVRRFHKPLAGCRLAPSYTASCCPAHSQAGKPVPVRRTFNLVAEAGKVSQVLRSARNINVLALQVVARQAVPGPGSTQAARSMSLAGRWTGALGSSSGLPSTACASRSEPAAPACACCHYPAWACHLGTKLSPRSCNFNAPVCTSCRCPESPAAPARRRAPAQGQQMEGRGQLAGQEPK